MKKLLSIIFIFIFSLSSFGQADLQKATQKVIVEKTNGDKISGIFVDGNSEFITIDLDGSKVNIKLIDIGVLRFNENSKSGKNESETVPFSIEAALIYRSGQVVPVARTPFYLLDDDIITILKNAGVKPTDSTLRTYSDYATAIFTDIGFAVRYGSLPAYQTFSVQVAQAIKPHIKFTFQTDFSGKASIPNVPIGKYYLFGFGSTRQSGVVWNLPVDTENTKFVTLDTNNAAFAY